MKLPKVLIIDDLFGRNVPGGRNVDRDNLCAHFLLKDVTWDIATKASDQKVITPIAECVFCRAQSPVCANVGDIIENDIESALAIVRTGWPPGMGVSSQESNVGKPWSMLLLDLCFYTGRVTDESHRRSPGMPEGKPSDDDPANYFGLTLLDAIHSEFPELPIIILSSKPREEVSLEFSQRGALGFIARDDVNGPEKLEKALWQHGLLPDPTGEMAGHSLKFLLALREARRAACHRESILIYGERGTGKELLADFVHRMSALWNGKEQPFVKVNSAVFTPTLFSSELFGIQPRTATGVDGKIGLIESANNGDLFLDEIADMPGEVQGAILRVLQERQITQVGSRISKDVDVRFLSATNTDLENDERRFRSDLLDRLRNGGTLVLPSLRERLSDIILLSEKFIREAESQRKGALKRQITSEALNALLSYDWPGNIRELRSVIFDAVSRHPDVEHLVVGHLRMGMGNELKIEGSEESALKISNLVDSSPQSGPGQGSTNDFDQLIELLDRFEFTVADRTAWVGKFGQLQSALARLVAKYIKAALLANRRPTLENPEGEILIHPAMKLLTGDQKLTATKAADFIKRQLNLSKTDKDNIMEDDVLRKAHEIALRLRPTSGQKKSGTKKEPTS